MRATPFQLSHEAARAIRDLKAAAPVYYHYLGVMFIGDGGCNTPEKFARFRGLLREVADLLDAEVGG